MGWVGEGEMGLELGRGGDGRGMVVGVSDVFWVWVERESEDMNVGIMGMGMFVGYVGVIGIGDVVDIGLGEV